MESSGIDIRRSRFAPVTVYKEQNDSSTYDSYFDSIPPGYRFQPLDEELVVYYLKKKIDDEPLPLNRIQDVELYKFSPDSLAEIYKPHHKDPEGETWYFFTPREKKYLNGKRPSRSAGDGYWKATGADKCVIYKSDTVGYKKSLVFYRGKAPKGDKTDWKMHEFTIQNPHKRKARGNDMRLDDWVLCRVYKKIVKLKAGVQIQKQQNDLERKTHGDHPPQISEMGSLATKPSGTYDIGSGQEIVQLQNLQHPQNSNGYQQQQYPDILDLPTDFDDQWLTFFNN